MEHNYTVLETERLILQQLNWDLFPELAILLANPVVHRHFPSVLDENEAREFLAQVIERQMCDGYSFWAVFKKDDSAFIGICGLLKQLIDDVEEVEMAYRFDDAYWGNGFGSEAAAECAAYARDILKANSIMSLIRPVNTQTIHVAEKTGFSHEKETLFHGVSHGLYRLKFQRSR